MRQPALRLQKLAAALAILGAFSLSGCGGGSHSTVSAAASPQGNTTGRTTSPTYLAQIDTTGLPNSATVSLLDNDASVLTVSANGSVSFPANWSGNAYAVTLKSHTPGIACSVTHGSGPLGSSDVTVDVACAAGSETVLHSFVLNTDAEHPMGGVIMDSSGSLYGTTYNGGTNGTGTVFKLSPGASAYSESILHSFIGSSDGANPDEGLVMDSSGNLYGTTYYGGTYGYGTVFKFTPDGAGGYTKTTLYSFGAASGDAWYPDARLLIDSSGNLYGTTWGGGAHANSGTVFELTPNGSGGYNEAVLYSFGASGDGQYPQSSLLMDSSGNLYGTTNEGGPNSTGTVFELKPSGSGYTESLLYSFGAYMGTDGQFPIGGLVMDASGNLYGTTTSGGTHGSGTVFALKPGGSGYTESLLYSFTGGADGQSPRGRLVMDSSGALFGPTEYGGSSGYGTVYELKPGGSGYTESVLYSFAGGTDGQDPRAGLMLDSSGNLYGTTYGNGGGSPYGTVFKID